jgi:hypothetical protein
MLNGVIDSREMRAQKEAQSTHSSGNSSVRRHSEDELKIIRLKEAMRKRDKYNPACLGQQQAMLVVS